MIQPQPTPEDLHQKIDGKGEISKSEEVLSDRIASYRRPRMLYGRDHELTAISTVYNRFIEQLRQHDDMEDVNSSKFILVHGDTGSGKSALIQHFFMNDDQPLMVDDARCFCISGEFAQMINLRTPNTAFLDAFTMYVQQVKERKLVEKVRTALQQSSITRDEIEVMTKIVPMFSVFFDRPESPSVNLHPTDKNMDGSLDTKLSNDAISDFKFALLKFLRVVATKTHPIVLILEDLHRADESALNLVTFLMNYTNNNAILFVGTTRDNLNSESLDITLQKLSSFETVVTHITLHNLDPMSTMSMISDILDMVDRNLLHTILEIIKYQSMCNPYGILTFLTAMTQNRCFTKNEMSAIPTWQLHSTKMQYFNRKSIDDVITEKLALLPSHVLQSLRFAALFDTTIDTEILGHLMKATRPEILSYLKISAENGFLAMNSSGEFSFVHEFIIDTLLHSMTKDEREEFYYKAGRRLWQCYDLEQLDENILVVIRLLLVGKRYIANDRERVAIAKLCLRSGEQLVCISSFRSAFSYVMSGIALMGKDCWKCEYQLALDLHNAAAELAFCTGKGSEALEMSNIIALEAKHFDDALTGHDIKIRALGAVGKVQESIDFGLTILSKLGESFPIKPSMFRCFIAFQMIRKRLKGRTSESLLRLPLMTDRRKTAAMKMMNQLCSVCIQLNPLMAVLVAFRVVSLTLDFGISATSCLGFVTVGALLGGPARDIDEAYRIGRVGMTMYKKFRIRVWLAPLYLMYFAGIHSFTHELSSTIEPLRYAAQIGEETGNIEESITCELFLCFVQLETRSLLKSLNCMNEIRKKMLFYGLTTIHALSSPTLQSLQTLSGLRDITSMTTYQQSDGAMFIFTHFHIMMLSIIFGDVDTAAKSSKHLRAFSAYPIGGVDAAYIAFFDGLTAVRLARREKKRHNIKYGMQKVKQMTIFVVHAPSLFLCRLYLLEAEIAATMGNNLAYPKYVSAIALANDCGSLAVASLANESAGHYCLNEKRDLHLAKRHFQQAIYFYDLWGVIAKVTQLTVEVRRIFGE